MVAFQLSPDMLGRTQFRLSPLAEVGSAVALLEQPSLSRVHQSWLRYARVATRDMDLRLLRALVPAGRWLPSLFYTPPTGPYTTLEGQLDRIEQDGIVPILADLELVWSDRPMPDLLRNILRDGDTGPRSITAAIRTFWHRAVEPHWSIIQSVLEEDVAHRAGRIVAGGMYNLLEDIHPDAAIDGDLLRIHKPHHADQNTINSCRGLTLIPSVFTYPKLIIDHDESEELVIVYGARGVGRTWEGLSRSSQIPEHTGSDHLGALLGRTRSTILTRLEVPMTTTQLAAALGQSAGTISEHLACLRDSGLLTAWRRGRRVYYRQTPLAGSLIAASGPSSRQRAT